MLTRVFKSGNSQAVRIPHELQFEQAVQSVEIERQGDALVIRPLRRPLTDLADRFRALGADFLPERPLGDAEWQERDGL